MSFGSKTMTRKNTSSVTLRDSAYTNALTGLGMLNNDKTTHTKANVAGIMQNDIELATMYLEDGIAATIAEAHPQTALAEDIKIYGDEDGAILKEMNAIGFTEAVVEAGIWSRLFGGAAIMTLYDGVTPFYKPPKESEKVIGYRAYSCTDFVLSNNDFVTDKTSRYYNEIENFKLRLENGNEINVHASRLTILRNKKAPRILSGLSFNQLFFGCSSVKEVDDALKNLGASMGGVSNMMTENGLKVFSLTGLSDMLQRKDGFTKLQQRMDAVNLYLSGWKSLFQDEKDKFSMVSHNFGGVDGIIRLMFVVTCAKSRIPMSMLFGQSITGLSGTNEGDMKIFNMDVSRWRTKVLYRPMCNIITEYCNRNGKKKDLVEFSFAPLGMLTGTEYANAKKTQADTCEKLFNMGAITSDEVRECCLKNGGSFEISVKD